MTALRYFRALYDADSIMLTRKFDHAEAKPHRTIMQTPIEGSVEPRVVTLCRWSTGIDLTSHSMTVQRYARPEPRKA